MTRHPKHGLPKRQNKGSSLARVKYWQGWARLKGVDLHFAAHNATGRWANLKNADGHLTAGVRARIARAHHGVGRPPLVTWGRWSAAERRAQGEHVARYGSLGETY